METADDSTDVQTQEAGDDSGQLVRHVTKVVHTFTPGDEFASNLVDSVIQQHTLSNADSMDDTPKADMDLVLVSADGHKCYMHQLVFATCGSYLYQLLMSIRQHRESGGCATCDVAVINLPDFSRTTVTNFVKLAYSGSVKLTSETEIQDLQCLLDALHVDISRPIDWSFCSMPKKSRMRKQWLSDDLESKMNNLIHGLMWWRGRKASSKSCERKLFSDVANRAWSTDGRQSVDSRFANEDNAEDDGDDDEEEEEVASDVDNFMEMAAASLQMQSDDEDDDNVVSQYADECESGRIGVNRDCTTAVDANEEGEDDANDTVDIAADYNEENAGDEYGKSAEFAPEVEMIVGDHFMSVEDQENEDVSNISVADGSSMDMTDQPSAFDHDQVRIVDVSSLAGQGAMQGMPQIDFTCRICGKYNSSAASLFAHLLYPHYAHLWRDEVPNLDGVYRCREEKCKYSTNKRQNYVMHLARVHEGLRKKLEQLGEAKEVIGILNSLVKKNMLPMPEVPPGDGKYIKTTVAKLVKHNKMSENGVRSSPIGHGARYSARPSAMSTEGNAIHSEGQLMTDSEVRGPRNVPTNTNGNNRDDDATLLKSIATMLNNYKGGATAQNTMPAEDVIKCLLEKQRQNMETGNRNISDRYSVGEHVNAVQSDVFRRRSSEPQWSSPKEFRSPVTLNESGRPRKMIGVNRPTVKCRLCSKVWRGKDNFFTHLVSTHYKYMWADEVPRHADMYNCHVPGCEYRSRYRYNFLFHLAGKHRQLKTRLIESGISTEVLIPIELSDEEVIQMNLDQAQPNGLTPSGRETSVLHHGRYSPSQHRGDRYGMAQGNRYTDVHGREPDVGYKRRHSAGLIGDAGLNDIKRAKADIEVLLNQGGISVHDWQALRKQLDAGLSQTSSRSSTNTSNAPSPQLDTGGQMANNVKGMNISGLGQVDAANRLVCYLCSKVTSDATAHRAHMVTHHFIRFWEHIKPSRVEIETGRSVFDCSYSDCRYEATNKNVFAKHLAYTHDELWHVLASDGSISGPTMSAIVYGKPGRSGPRSAPMATQVNSALISRLVSSAIKAGQPDGGDRRGKGKGGRMTMSEVVEALAREGAGVKQCGVIHVPMGSESDTGQGMDVKSEVRTKDGELASIVQMMANSLMSGGDVNDSDGATSMSDQLVELIASAAAASTGGDDNSDSILTNIQDQLVKKSADTADQGDLSALLATLIQQQHNGNNDFESLQMEAD